MPTLVSALVFAILVATIPFTFVLKVLQRLPQPLAASHRRWPLPLNFGLIAFVTAAAAVFVRGVYSARGSSAAEVAAEFLIVALCYGFALVLLLRQFSGVYAEFIVTTGPTGLGLRKTTYRSIRNVEKVADAGGETRFRIETSRDFVVTLSVPTRHVSIFYDQMAKLRNEQ